MGVIERLQKWLEPHVINTTIYQCLGCNSIFLAEKLIAENSICPKCGAEIHTSTIPVVYNDWEPSR